jgi:hypothetical protein
MKRKTSARADSWDAQLVVPISAFSSPKKLSAALDAIAQECADHGITAQHNRPLTTDYIAEQAVDFERRWQALTRHHAHPQQ